MNKITIAVITPGRKEDYLVRTIVDGLEQLRHEALLGDIKYTDNNPRHFKIKEHELKRNNFIEYAKKADIILYCWGKVHENKDLVHIIGRYNATAYIDGSELGHNKRLEPQIVQQLEQGTYAGQGSIDEEMLKKCTAYFRREKPYTRGILPLPYGIESVYTSYGSNKSFKDRVYDVICVFGQKKFPPLREKVAMLLEEIQKTGRLKIWNKSTKLPFLSPHNFISRRIFYQKLSNSRIGISVSGGGYDTARFWEILGSGAFLLTQKIDIDFPNGISIPKKLYKEFSSEDDFEEALNNSIKELETISEVEQSAAYKELLQYHSSKARVLHVLQVMCERCSLSCTIR